MLKKIIIFLSILIIVNNLNSGPINFLLINDFMEAVKNNLLEGCPAIN